MVAAAANARHLMHVFPAFERGGVPIRIATIVNRWGRRYRHTIISLSGDEGAKARLAPETDVAFLSAPPEAGGLTRRLRAVRGVLRTAAPDLLITYNWGATEWAMANRLAPLCAHIHCESGFGPEEATRQLRRRVLFRRLALARSRCLVVPSRNLADIATRIWRLDPARVRYIPNGVDCDLYGGPADPAAIPGFARRGGEVVVGTLAPLRAEKNISRLIRAFAPLAETGARLLIVGDGAERGLLDSLAAELGLAEAVFFAGHVERPEKVLGLMDVFAMSSDTEQMPNSLLQAMAAGLPVAALEVGDVAAIVAAENRPLVAPAGDQAGLRDALSRLIAEADLRRTLGARNQDRARATYGQETMFTAYRDLWDG
ncbi:MAG: glycosyltransferase [Alphaproteobacteria bacterium]